jgi:hypothetical protein
VKNVDVFTAVAYENFCFFYYVLAWNYKHFAHATLAGSKFFGSYIRNLVHVVCHLFNIYDLLSIRFYGHMILLEEKGYFSLLFS